MREILFRGKRLDNGKWVMGFYVHHRNVAHYILDVSYGGYEDIDGGFFVPRWYAVEPSSVGQYTGLNDKNGNRIFEGDIISIPLEEDRSPWEENVVYYENGMVYYDEQRYGWYVRFFDGEELSLWEYDECGVRIVCNMYDNPELLEAETC